ncbi:MAG TPA: 16S rRNA (guanine(966)-N(2))-methyltransferase RsmD [Rhodothermales bacterium]|nr:16S rRNA (guanine(966)-N(2))-methyltransferase RsmD [Rhodothermales bacterium]
MRIIAGRFRRKSLLAPSGDRTRPTTDRAREAVFSMVESRIYLEGARVLDLFAGTGALGLEALSRGADTVTFVEQDAAVLNFARRNAEALGVEADCAFFRSDAVAFLEHYGGPGFDLILADPPYELPDLPRLPELTLAHLEPDGLFMLEHDVRHSFDEHPNLETSRRYGRTVVSVFRSEPVEQDEEEG